MAHIHTGDGQHDLTVSGFVVRSDFDEPKLILHMHKKLGKYVQFGGHVELNENPWQAVAHELKEESGYDIADLKVLQPADRLSRLSGTILHPQPVCVNTHDFPGMGYKHSHIDVLFGFVADREPKSAVGEGESAEIVLFTKQELIDVPADQIIENVREIGLHILDVCYPNWEQIATSDFIL